MIASETITIPFEITAGGYSPAFLEAVQGGGAWSREARVVLALAAARGILLDESELVLEDARDLRARRDALTGSSSRR